MNIQGVVLLQIFQNVITVDITLLPLTFQKLSVFVIPDARTNKVFHTL